MMKVTLSWNRASKKPKVNLLRKSPELIFLERLLINLRQKQTNWKKTKRKQKELVANLKLKLKLIRWHKN